jgi:MFS family permease
LTSEHDLRESKGRTSFGFSPSTDLGRYLISSFNANLVVTIFSLFLPLLAASLGATVFEIGLVGGSSNVVYSFMPFVMGHFSDRRGSRKFFIASSFSILSVISAIYFIVSNPVTLIIARVFEGIGWAMLWPAVEAAISKDISPTDSKKALSVFNFTWSGGAAVGPLLGSALIFFTNLRDAFLLTTVILVATVALNIYPFLAFNRARSTPSSEIVSDAPEVIDSAAGSPQVATGGELPSKASRFGSEFYMLCVALATVSTSILFTFFSPLAKSQGVSIVLIGVITFVFGFTRFLVYVLTINSRFRHFLLRNDKRVRNIVVAIVLMSLSSLLIVVHEPSALVYVGVYAIVGAGYSLVYAISQAAMIADASPSKVGRSAGLFESSIGIGGALGPVIAGGISGSSLSFPFILPSLGLIFFAVAFPFVTKTRRH